MAENLAYFVFVRMYGAVQKVCHQPRGEGVKQNSDKVWKGGGGVKSNSDFTLFIFFYMDITQNLKVSIREISLMSAQHFILWR